jgi:MFS family permease
LSALLVAFGLWLRRGVDETPAFLKLKSRQATAHAPVKEVFRIHKRPLLVSIGLRIGPDVCYGMFAVFSLTYITTVLHLPRSLALAVTMVGAICNAVFIPILASLSDRIGRRPVYAIGTVLAIAWVWIYFALMDTLRPILIGLAVAVGMMLHAAMYGPQAAFIAEQFPARVRYAGSSLAYTLAGVIAGGPAPLIIAAIYRSNRSTLGVSLYLALALAVTLVVLWRAHETAGAPLTD